MEECLTFYGVTFTYSTKFEQNISRSKRYICCLASTIPAGYLKCAGSMGARMHERINGSVVEICKISINVQLYVKYLYVHMITSDPNVFFLLVHFLCLFMKCRFCFSVYDYSRKFPG